MATDLCKVCPQCQARYSAENSFCPRDAAPLSEVTDRASEDPLLGTTLSGTYQIVRVIGEGGMGKVYEARHARLTRRFAIKVLHAELARNADILARFRREAESAAAVAHRNVLEVFDVANTDTGRPYIVGEFLDGKDFHDFLEQVHRLEVPMAVSITRQICSGLQAAHDLGIVHRDLKPENIFVLGVGADGSVSQSPVVKILDFGISKVLGHNSQNLTRTGVIMGTPNYMAPEQARGGQVDHRADIYALGAILYRMLTGKRAYDGKDAASVLAAVQQSDPIRPRIIEPSIPETMEVIIQRAMAKDVRDRYQSMTELDADLASFDTTPAHGPIASFAALHPDDSAPADSAAKTFMGQAAPPGTVVTVVQTHAKMREIEAKGREVRFARPTILVLTPVMFGWIYVNLVSAIVYLFWRTPRPDNVATMMVAVAIIGFILVGWWIYYVARNVWHNSLRAMEIAGDLRRGLGASMLGYAVCALIIRFGYGVATLPRSNDIIGAAGWDFLLFIAGLVAGIGAGGGPIWIRLRRRHYKN